VVEPSQFRYHWETMRSLQLQRSRRAKPHQRAFTLVELMTVVAILGILSAVAVTLVRGHMRAAKTTSALAGVGWVKSGQTAFRSEHGQFLDCSGTTAKYYPMETPGTRVYSWVQSHQDYARWAALGLPKDGGTQFGYLVNAGLAGQAYPLLQTAVQPTIPPSADPWYVIQFASDLDGDGVLMKGVASSVNAEVYVEHEGE
jgi:prepilin-type N-terminal cleavage/methylation domain-containing protein